MYPTPLFRKHALGINLAVLDTVPQPLRRFFETVTPVVICSALSSPGAIVIRRGPMGGYTMQIPVKDDMPPYLFHKKQTLTNFTHINNKQNKNNEMI